MPTVPYRRPSPGEFRVSPGSLRLARALAPHRIALAGALTLLMSARVLMAPYALDFHDAGELVVLVGRQALELLPAAAVILVAYALADEWLPADVPWRLAAFVPLLLLASAAATLGFWALGPGVDRLPGVAALGSQVGLWATPAVFCALIAEADRRSRRLDMQALAVRAENARLEREAIGQQLQLLEAQIEPHFLFNTLANLRRLYRTRPESAAAVTARLQHYLRSALPQLRRRDATLGDELALVESYLELFRMRMGDRLAFAIDAGEALRLLGFPPVLLLTLVENAIKHGVDPRPEGGRVEVRAHRQGTTLWVEVLDDGVGFGVAPSGGTGVGLANVRSRLAVLFGRRAGLALQSRAGGGVAAVVHLPAQAALPAAGGCADG
jgi:hypothetical protein